MKVPDVQIFCSMNVILLRSICASGAFIQTSNAIASVRVPVRVHDLLRGYGRNLSATTGGRSIESSIHCLLTYGT